MTTRASGGKYLIFALGEEEFGLPIQKVKEIIGMLAITRVPKASGYIKGVINLRGKIIPVMDLRLKFGLDEKKYDERTCLIVVEMADSSKLIAVAVDSVSEVLSIQNTEIEAPPEYSSQGDTGFLRGIGKVKDRVILLLDADGVIGSQDLAYFKRNIDLGGEIHVQQA
jgi:purine-binding chemotaxis protein CheW